MADKPDARRDRLIEAAESTEGFGVLRDLVKRQVDAGVPKETLLDDLGQIRGLLAEEAEERIFDVMDLLVGWCAPGARIGE